MTSNNNNEEILPDEEMVKYLADLFLELTMADKKDNMTQNNNNSLDGRSRDAVSVQPLKGAANSAPGKRLTKAQRKQRARIMFTERHLEYKAKHNL